MSLAPYVLTYLLYTSIVKYYSTHSYGILGQMPMKSPTWSAQSKYRLKSQLQVIAFLLVAVPMGAYLIGLNIYSRANEPRVLGDHNKAVDPRATLPDATNAKKSTFVSTKGIDTPERGSEKEPFRTITYALSQATPGTRIEVAAGTYAEFITTAKNASAQQPIVLAAKDKVVLKGDDKSGRIMELKHDYYVIDGFEFTGKDILLWMQDADHSLITNNYFHHAQGECVRLKYHSSANVIEKNRIEHCGIEDFTLKGGGKNGEGVYIGTAPEQLYRNPTPESDGSDANIVANNTIATRGNECVDIKEGSSYNIVEFNDCTAQKDKHSGGLDSRGNQNIFRYNYIYKNSGAGIRFGGDEKSDGLRNQAYGNKIENNKNVAVKVQRTPQGLICGNQESGNKKFSNKKEVTNPKCPFELEAAGLQK